jgi:hypothetical protein
MTRPTRATVEALLILWATTAAAALLVLPARPAVRSWLALRLAPHHAATLGDASAIALHNATAAALPLACALAAPASRALRRLADGAVLALLGLNAAIAGAALGAYGPAILRYLPHLPGEWTALALAAGAWGAARDHRTPQPAALRARARRHRRAAGGRRAA